MTTFENTLHSSRARILRPGEASPGPIIYAMSRDQRVRDNWALLYAQSLAINSGQPFVVAALLLADYPTAVWRQAKFSIDGLKLVERDLTALGIPMVATLEPPDRALMGLASQLAASAIVTDFSPLRAGREWRQLVAATAAVPVHEVDTHNIVPAWVASNKQEFAAYTIRPKITRLLHRYLTEIPAPVEHPYTVSTALPRTDWRQVERSVKADRSIPPALGFESGERAALAARDRFITQRLPHYHDRRNDPTAAIQTDLSPYLHFGQIAAQQIALAVQPHDVHLASQEAFLEELIIRRELSDNYCLYNPFYDSLDGAPAWARQTLDAHRRDIREHVYTLDQFECADTHDPLWNAAQTELTVTGKMHGYMRMYWAKKILEWSPSPETAFETAIRLNDRYELDGCDPNGYAGVAWSIAGVHDRAWPERSVFGKIRYMNLNGCRRKFDVDAYIAAMNKRRAEVSA
jgi:deoxyribodipyrimidine photo-lyase